MRPSPGHDPPSVHLDSGRCLGPYQILGRLGGGGMGDVYRARDTRLDRDVAVKVLLPGAAVDPDRVRRFEQEAKAVGALSHPNLVAVFDVGHDTLGPYVVFELLEGETLRHRLASGAIGVRKAVDYAIQIARGLAAAHDKHISHRDLKPDNVFLTRDGRVKVLDFGLAKLRGDVDPSVLRPEDATASDITGAGALLGTAAYMSPEQVRGLPADPRSDIFAFGVVLYEMLSGRRAFRGDSAVETMNAILKEEPPALSSMAGNVPPYLERVVRHCLEKKPEDRFQSARDVAFALEASEQGTEAGWPRRARRMRLVAAACSACSWSPAPSASGPSTTSGTRPLPRPMRIVPVTSFSGRESNPAFSPDGTRLAFSWDGGGGNRDIYVQLIGAGTPLRLTTNPAVDRSPTWSPDGRYIAFLRSGTDGGETDDQQGLFTVPALGGAERKLQASRCGPWGWRCRLDWSPDGTLIAFPDQTSAHTFGIFLVSMETLERRRLTAPPEEHQDDAIPAFSPDGRWIAFARVGGTTRPSLNVVPVAGGEARRVSLGDVWTSGEIDGQTWTPDGRSLVAAWSPAQWTGASLWRVPVSGGVPEQMAVGGDSASQPSTSRRGNRLAFMHMYGDWDTWEIALSGSPPRGGSPRRLISSSRKDIEAQLSPDGSRIAFSSDRSGPTELWMCDRDGTNAQQLTHTGSAGVPRWSPDGRRIAFESNTGEGADIYVLEAAGGRPRRLTPEASTDAQPSWSGDSRWVYFPSNRRGGFQVWKAPADGGPAVQVTRHGGFLAFESPDGKLLYFAKAGAAGIWSVPVDGGEEKLVHHLPVAEYWDGWGVGRQGLYFVDVEAKPHPAIALLSLATRRVTRIAEVDTPPTEAGRPTFLSIARDERSIFYSQTVQAGSDIVMVEGFR